MSGRAIPSDPARVARVIHGAIAGGLVLVYVALSFVHDAIALSGTPDLRRYLAIIAGVLLAGVVLVTALFRGRIPRHRAGADPAEWWKANLHRAILVWALAEGGGLAAIVLGTLADSRVPGAAGLVVALFILYVSRPGALAER